MSNSQRNNRNKWTRRHNKRGDRLRAIGARRRREKRVGIVQPESTQPPGSRDNGGGELEKGLVAGVQRGGHAQVFCNGELVPAQLAIDLANQGVSLAVGDRVRFMRTDQEDNVIATVEPRATRLARLRGDTTRRSDLGHEEAVLAANVDRVIIVASATQPTFHPKFVDRYLVIAQYGGIDPIICITKTDLVESPPDLSIYDRLGVPVVYTSAETGAGMEQLRQLLDGNVSVFTGQSGVGKSSLVNALLHEERQEVGSVRRADGRGRHTTTSSMLIQLDDDTFVIDTPGIRALGLGDIDTETLRQYFPEFQAFAPYCQFSDCSHSHEPRCAVKAAVESNQLSRDRYESYLRMLSST